MADRPDEAPLRADLDPSLLDVVPRLSGYAHSWALAALLSDERMHIAILSATSLRTGSSRDGVRAGGTDRRSGGRRRSLAVRPDAARGISPSPETKADGRAAR